VQEVTKFLSLSQRVITQSSSVSVKQKEPSQYFRNSFVETVVLVHGKKKSNELNPYVKECVQNYLDIHTYNIYIYIIVFINVRNKIYIYPTS